MFDLPGNRLTLHEADEFNQPGRRVRSRTGRLPTWTRSWLNGPSTAQIHRGPAAGRRSGSWPSAREWVRRWPARSGNLGGCRDHAGCSTTAPRSGRPSCCSRRPAQGEGPARREQVGAAAEGILSTGRARLMCLPSDLLLLTRAGSRGWPGRCSRPFLQACRSGRCPAPRRMPGLRPGYPAGRWRGQRSGL